MKWYDLEKSLGASEEMIEYCQKFLTREDFYSTKDKPIFILWSLHQNDIRSIVDRAVICKTLKRLSRNKSAAIRDHIASDIRTPEIILKRMTRSEDPQIRTHAIMSLNRRICKSII